MSPGVSLSPSKRHSLKGQVVKSTLAPFTSHKIRSHLKPTQVYPCPRYSSPESSRYVSLPDPRARLKTKHRLQKTTPPTATMKLLTYFLVGISATTALALRSPNTGPNAEAECGALGVMEYDPADLPEGVSPADIRKCKEHPLGHGQDILRRLLPSWLL